MGVFERAWERSEQDRNLQTVWAFSTKCLKRQEGSSEVGMRDNKLSCTREDCRSDLGDATFQIF
ncbi:hypothetical protein KI387_012337, partial [Taxus chinensis]